MSPISIFFVYVSASIFFYFAVPVEYQSLYKFVFVTFFVFWSIVGVILYICDKISNC